MNTRPSRTTIYAAVGTFAAAAAAVTVLTTGPAMLTAPGTRAFAVAAAAGQSGAAGQAVAQPVNPVLSARQALPEHYAAAQAARGAAAARRTADTAAGQAAARQKAASGSPQQIAISMLPSFGWSSGEFSCLTALWQRESGWNPYAANPSSGAYGIPQALPGSKMASAGPDWQTSAATQIRWGLGYIQATYGSPCGAWGHESNYGWY